MKKRWHSPLSKEECLSQMRLTIGYPDHWTTGLQGKISQDKFMCWYKIALQRGNSYKPLSGRVETDSIKGGSIITIESKLSDFIFNKYISLAILVMTISVFVVNGEFDFSGFFWGLIFPTILFNIVIMIANSLFWLFTSAEKTYAKFKEALMDCLRAKEIE